MRMEKLLYAMRILLRRLMHMIKCLGLQPLCVKYMILQPSMLLAVPWKVSMGDQRSPGIIPMAIKDAFSIIQETPSREYLLRLSYLEIYNEAVNDLLNPGGQHLRIREDGQGTFVEGITEEVVLSPGHALSIIAAGEEQRHVGSTNFNLHSSRSHTIFTLTIESSPCGENNENEAVNLSQLNLIDLAGSESSKAETTGIRRKEGSYINKSLLTLGTVISKLTDERAAHIPYRDSKLTRLLQSSLSGHGRVSLICTVTPSSSNSEETHNTLKFAHRAKHIEIKAAQNKIIDGKSLIKTYQNKIRSLKEDLEQLHRDTATAPQLNDALLSEELDDGQVKLQSKLEKEVTEDALLSQIQNLTKLILVSNKSLPLSSFPDHTAPRCKYSFGEEELAYLPHRRRDLILDDEIVQLHINLDEGTEAKNDALKEEDTKTKKPGLLDWLKPRKRDDLTSAGDKSSRAKSTSTSSSSADKPVFPVETRNSYSSPSESTSVGFLSEAREDQNINKDAFLQQEAPLSVSMLEAQLNECAIELEAQVTDNQVLQEKLNQKTNESKGLEETITALKQEVSDTHDLKNVGELITETENTTINDGDMLFQQAQAFEIEQLKEMVNKLTESNKQLEAENKILADESSYAKELAAEAAVELQALTEEVMKLMNHNEKLSAALAGEKHSPVGRKTMGPTRRKKDQSPTQLELKRELALSKERELAYEDMLSEKYKKESELQEIVNESKQQEAYLENELANMWILLAKLRSPQEDSGLEI